MASGGDIEHNLAIVETGSNYRDVGQVCAATNCSHKLPNLKLNSNTAFSKFTTGAVYTYWDGSTQARPLPSASLSNVHAAVALHTAYF